MRYGLYILTLPIHFGNIYSIRCALCGGSNLELGGTRMDSMEYRAHCRPHELDIVCDHSLA